MNINKKGAITLGKDMAIGTIILILFLIFLFGGGFGTILNFTQILKSIPTFIWIILGIIILFKVLGGKR